ncbi:MAPEG family protein [Simiduia aestuariiviva]|uniref:Putative MAPEG superfamily protein n=1 Tax=Simiduia aestuariiviva TaxID=1510459 RepID=A0A839UNH5_9GAMM|nr:MAPEG family protein [Simiduia aestuariiviva]MBB3169734.1 putative MAPEG superfamily protein [Simiduia aestuariiviva]
MSIPIACLIIAALLILISKAPVAVAMARLDGRYDNRNPRAQQARLQGFGARALAAHHNCIEAFPLFAAGVLAALWAGASEQWVNALSIIFIVARVCYLLLYWYDWDKVRSLVWGVGLTASLWLMALAL